MVSKVMSLDDDIRLDLNMELALNASAKWLINRSRTIENPEYLLKKFTENRRIEDPAKSLLIAFYVILVCIGAAGNFLVVLSVLRKQSMRTARNMFIVNLAISDLLVCTVGTPLTLMELITKYWPLPNWPGLCKACGAIQAISIFVSTISITAIALDRYQLIIFPTRPALQKLGAFITMLIIWCIACSLASPLFIFRTLHIHANFAAYGINKTLGFCVEDWPIQDGRLIYSLCSLIFQYVLPVSIVAIAHFQINERLKERQKTLKTARKKKTSRILIAIVVTYIISWLPLNVFNLVADSSPDLISDEHTMTVTYAICHMFGMSSAVTNPLLYGWLNKNFRDEFEELLCCCQKRDSQKDRRPNKRNLDTELSAVALVDNTMTVITRTKTGDTVY